MAAGMTAARFDELDFKKSGAVSLANLAAAFDSPDSAAKRDGIKKGDVAGGGKGDDGDDNDSAGNGPPLILIVGASCGGEHTQQTG